MGAYDTDFTYRNLVLDVLYDGELRESRSGNTYSIFGAQTTYDLSEGHFPLLTTKKINFNNILHELNWFLRGNANIKTLKAPQLWEPWAKKNGYCGPIYGEQWRNWGCTYIDQITNLIDGLKENPNGRRHIVSAWNVVDIPDMVLPPCHTLFQCYVRKGQFLDLQLYQRSGDIAIGIPYNIASYSLLLMMLANEVGLAPGRFIHSIGDLHAYTNHRDNLLKQVSRKPREAPSLTLKKSFWELVEEDDPLNYQLDNYDPHGPLKFEVAV
jgi:thymidylate synthase